MTSKLDDAIRKFQKNGWVAVPFRNQPPAVRRAIKLAHMRPLMKQCFANAQRLLLGQSEYSFQYHEGIVQSIVPIEHAWLSLDGEVVDVTLSEKPTILAEYTATPDEIRIRMIKTGVYGPVNPRRLAALSNAVVYGIDPTLPEDSIMEKVEKIFGVGVTLC